MTTTSDAIPGAGVRASRRCRRPPDVVWPRRSTGVRAPSWRSCWPRRSAGCSSPTSARWSSCSSRRSGRSTRSAATSSPSHRSRTSRSSSRPRSTGRSRSGRSGSRRSSRSPTSSWPSPSPTTWRASRRPGRAALLVVSILLPLWSGYLVKVYAWRLILSEERLLNWILAPFGLKGPGYGDVAVWLVMSYLWLPYMIIPIFAGLERIPGSLLEASADLGARSCDDVPAGHPAAGLPGGRRGLDLHVLADARRLHHPDPGLGHASSSATSSTRTSAWRATSRWRRRTRSCPRDHDHLPARRAPARRVRGPLMAGRSAHADRAAPRDRRDARLHLHPDRRHRPVLVQRERPRAGGRSRS